MKLNLLISFGSSLKEHIIIMGNSLGKRLVVVYCILYLYFLGVGRTIFFVSTLQTKNPAAWRGLMQN